MATVVLPTSFAPCTRSSRLLSRLSDGRGCTTSRKAPKTARCWSFLHGYPTWSFIYRAPLVYYGAAGYRCIAVDLMGFGLSDKPANKRYHTLRQHIQNLFEFLTLLDLHNITLIMEDWGGRWLSYAIQRPDNVKPPGDHQFVGVPGYLPQPVGLAGAMGDQAGHRGLLFGTFNIVFNVLIQRWTARLLSEAVLSAYKAPFRDARQRAALIQFPRMINITPEHPSAEVMRGIEQNLSALRAIPTLILWAKTTRSSRLTWLTIGKGCCRVPKGQ